MNFTLGLLAGLVLLLPGLTALATWSFRGAGEGAARPELPLTSVTALFIVISVAAALHLIGFFLSHVLWAAAIEVGAMAPGGWWLPPPAPEPYLTLWRLVMKDPKAGLSDVLVFLTVDLVLVVAAVRIVMSKGLDLLLDGADVRGQGWVHQNIVRPKRNGYQPFAYVLTGPAHGEFGIGYQGMVAEIRQGADGEIKSLCLSEPEAFLYELKGTQPSSSARKVAPPRPAPRLKLHERRWLGGVVALEASAIRNIVIHNVPASIIEAFMKKLDISPEEGGGGS